MSSLIQVKSHICVLCSCGRQCKFEMQRGENTYLLQREVVCVWTDFCLGESRNLVIHLLHSVGTATQKPR